MNSDLFLLINGCNMVHGMKEWMTQSLLFYDEIKQFYPELFEVVPYRIRQTIDKIG